MKFVILNHSCHTERSEVSINLKRVLNSLDFSFAKLTQNDKNSQKNSAKQNQSVDISLTLNMTSKAKSAFKIFVWIFALFKSKIYIEFEFLFLG